MEPHNDFQNYPSLPHLLGTDLYSELFDNLSLGQSINQGPQDNDQRFQALPDLLSTDTDVQYSNHHSVRQPNHMVDNPQGFQGLSFIPFLGGSSLDFEIIHDLPCPLDMESYAEPLFDCDCGETFNNLESMIEHRETVPQHRPWHGVWEAQGSGVCLCGRSFDNEDAVHRHIRLAHARMRRQRVEERLIKFQQFQQFHHFQQLEQLQQQQVTVRPIQRSRPSRAGRSRSLKQEEELKLRQHVKKIDKLIVEETMFRLMKSEDDMADRKVSQKQRKQLEKEKAKRLTA